MKKIFPVALLPLMAAIILSCSQDEPQAGQHQENTTLKMASSTGTSSHSTIGTTHNLILDELLLHPLPVPTSPAEIDSTVAARMQHHGFPVSGCGDGNPAGLASTIVQEPMPFYKNWLPFSDLSAEAVTFLTDFLQEFQAIHDRDAQLVLVGSALPNAQADTALTPGDKEILLTVLSITEASLLYGKERKDKDWETSVGNIVAAARGAQHGTPYALRLSLTAGMIQHYKNPTD
ncbi:hypothetical protein MH928_13505 [Flavobacterium sp. WW92]|uniref:hypothetical protein n=1 Tax=unclassified Flavobacterium TaxID=196869 RepID=UPI002224243F|nr:MULTISPECIES: hypothetical protein [unclassified Flavobacterium]WDO12336.1 hypothetical protein MH928_13505 [Flavobacterium sp. WW92]